ncbi:hypothetical protein BBK36DRAFT_168501 [Trichoderma citrinoviride]|uniref:HFB protein n=1 Tax=Trichoderma citrinoviride TaxID=58853 RepID=A0A2T4BDJ0_9HYPO|nr:hypothetical protein BBK36DRAFT_168501 [Trichoderma citrinoviride]PTB67259.1 hypothetical protein BBK36DRAFT_168501 [Trichoderma citrinoviride]
MRFSIVLSGLFAALAAAQSSSSAAQAPSSTVSLDPAQASQVACIKACAKGDVNCQAHCIEVPSPNQSQVNATTQCVAKCPQGNGSAAQTNTYKLCIDKCINDHYFVTSEGTPSATPAPGSDNQASGTATDSAAAPTGTDSSATSRPPRTSSASASATTNAAPAMIASGGALMGVVAALMAL